MKEMQFLPAKAPVKPTPAQTHMAVMHGGFGLGGSGGHASATPPMRRTPTTCGEGKEARVLRGEECQIWAAPGMFLRSLASCSSSTSYNQD